MGRSFVFLDSAAREFESIEQYLSETLKSPQAAEHFADEFERRIKHACTFPSSCPLCADERMAARGYRSFAVMKYVVLYRFDEKHVYVAHLFHQTQDYASCVVRFDAE